MVGVFANILVTMRTVEMEVEHLSTQARGLLCNKSRFDRCYVRFWWCFVCPGTQRLKANLAWCALVKTYDTGS